MRADKKNSGRTVKRKGKCGHTEMVTIKLCFWLSLFCIIIIIYPLIARITEFWHYVVTVQLAGRVSSDDHLVKHVVGGVVHARNSPLLGMLRGGQLRPLVTVQGSSTVVLAKLVEDWIRTESSQKVQNVKKNNQKAHCTSSQTPPVGGEG